MDYFYCGNFTINMDNETFWKWIDWQYNYRSAKPNNDVLDKVYCYHHFKSEVLLKLYKKYISQIINPEFNSTKKRFLLHSAHDVTIENLLASFKMWDFKVIKFAEMVVFEIYSADMTNQYNIDNNITHYFRITQSGKALKYRKCPYTNNTTLCDINILLSNEFYNLSDGYNWRYNKCTSALDRCQCGICDESSTTDINISSPLCHNKSIDIKSICIGIIIGAVIVLIMSVCPKLLKNNANNHQRRPAHVKLSSHDEIEMNVDNIDVEHPPTNTGKHFY